MRKIIYLFLWCGLILSSCSQGKKQQVENEREGAIIGFPSELGIGQTWNRSLTKRIGQVIGLESRRAGMDSLSLPPFTYGDSPYLVAELGIEMSKGLYLFMPLRDMDRKLPEDVRFLAAFERIVEESGILAENIYENISDTPAAELEEERKDHMAVAVQACRESIVLLKNKERVLPMDSSARIYHSLSFYDKKGRGEALEKARQADVISVSWNAESAGKTESKAWLETLCGLDKPVVLVLSGDRPFAVDASVEGLASAVIAAWFPQWTDYDLIGDVIRGSHSPGSRLTAAIYDTEGNLLYPMGHGLSYIPVTYSDLTLEPVDSENGRNIVVRFNVTNTGNRAGEEVALLYLRKVSDDEKMSGAESAKEARLEGFKRTNLKPGETKEIKFTIRKRNMESVDNDMKRFVEPGEYEVWLSGDVTPRRFTIGANGDYVKQVYVIKV